MRRIGAILVLGGGLGISLTIPLHAANSSPQLQTIRDPYAGITQYITTVDTMSVKAGSNVTIVTTSSGVMVSASASTTTLSVSTLTVSILTVSSAATIDSLSGVLKASAGLISGSATTTDLPEGSNLYFTTARATTAITATAPIFNTNGVISISTSGFPAGTTSYIQNRATLQSGATAFPDFVYVGTSGTVNGPWTVNTYLDMPNTATSAPNAGVARLNAVTTQGFTRFVETNEAPISVVYPRDNVYIAQNNIAGTALAAGTVVYISTASGSDYVPNIGKAKANSLNTLPATGILLSTLGTSAYGQVMQFGIITGGIDTSAFAVGDELWVSTLTAGAFTNIQPVYPNYPQRVGTVLVSDASNGAMFVSICPYLGSLESGTTAQNYTFGGSVTVSGIAYLQNGSTSTPSLAFTNQTSSGFFKPGSNRIGLVANGTQILDATAGEIDLLGNGTNGSGNFIIISTTAFNSTSPEIQPRVSNIWALGDSTHLFAGIFVTTVTVSSLTATSANIPTETINTSLTLSGTSSITGASTITGLVTASTITVSSFTATSANIPTATINTSLTLSGTSSITGASTITGLVTASTITVSSFTASNVSITGGQGVSVSTVSSTSRMVASTASTTSPVFSVGNSSITTDMQSFLKAPVVTVRAGDFGEIIATNTTSGQALASSGVYQNYVSISLTAGIWAVSGMMIFQTNGATATDYSIFISSFSGSSTSDRTFGLNTGYVDIGTGFATTSYNTLTVPPFQMTISAATTVYLKGNGTFTVGGPNIYAGSITAVRQ